MKQLLDKEIASELQDLGGLELGSAAYSQAINGASKLMEQRLEIDKIETERLKLKQADKERQDKLDLQQQQLKIEQLQLERDEAKLAAEREDRRISGNQAVEVANRQRTQAIITTIVTATVTVGLGIGSMLLNVWGTNKTLKFEETGTVTTSAGKSHINKLFK